ncbi:hypothetical protein VFC49_10305 [Thermococcus sp. SY098]|nr:hypothetical protein [Thermococcus sp. SY098]WRS52409.1 hypothetical protein VFC49_10305 [Thermococcus sp. SY098]
MKDTKKMLADILEDFLFKEELQRLLEEAGLKKVRKQERTS